MESLNSQMEGEKVALQEELAQLKEVKMKEFEVELMDKNNQINQLKGSLNKTEFSKTNVKGRTKNSK